MWSGTWVNNVQTNARAHTNTTRACVCLCVCVCVCVCVHIWLNILDISVNIFFFVTPFELPYRSYDIRQELVNKHSISCYFPSPLGRHQGRIYNKSYVSFACTLQLCKNGHLFFSIVLSLPFKIWFLRRYILEIYNPNFKNTNFESCANVFMPLANIKSKNSTIHQYKHSFLQSSNIYEKGISLL